MTTACGLCAAGHRTSECGKAAAIVKESVTSTWAERKRKAVA